MLCFWFWNTPEIVLLRIHARSWISGETRAQTNVCGEYKQNLYVLNCFWHVIGQHKLALCLAINDLIFYIELPNTATRKPKLTYAIVNITSGNTKTCTRDRALWSLKTENSVLIAIMKFHTQEIEHLISLYDTIAISFLYYLKPYLNFKYEKLYTFLITLVEVKQNWSISARTC